MSKKDKNEKREVPRGLLDIFVEDLTPVAAQWRGIPSGKRADFGVVRSLQQILDLTLLLPCLRSDEHDPQVESFACRAAALN